MTAPPSRAAITGLVLAGGRGQRLGGVDKGLQPWRGRALVDHAIERLAPQVGAVLISANRNAADYASRGARVLADARDDFPGPLAGMLAGLRAAGSPWLAVVPCDAPCLPIDLVERLARGLAGRDGAVVQRDLGPAGVRLEPVCCLLSTALADDLARYLDDGGRKAEAWLVRHAAPVRFDRPADAAAFANINTPDDLVR
ncbi:MAG: molybdenum cofactor guanylyltransferase [Burkholderiales bacterium]|jgi:molybdopterin-guanine dinucleotide biosynthesis protein A|nr:molybdenum cofactor guanylyltransferase [Burkholderiales bacterium]